MLVLIVLLSNGVGNYDEICVIFRTYSAYRTPSLCARPCVLRILSVSIYVAIPTEYIYCLIVLIKSTLYTYYTHTLIIIFPYLKSLTIYLLIHSLFRNIPLKASAKIFTKEADSS